MRVRLKLEFCLGLFFRWIGMDEGLGRCGVVVIFVLGFFLHVLWFLFFLVSVL